MEANNDMPRPQEDGNQGRFDDAAAAAAEDDDDTDSSSHGVDLPDPWAEPPNPPPTIVSESLPSVMAQDDPLRMHLLEDEYSIAWEIKGIFATASYINTVSDFNVAQHAIMASEAESPIEVATKRAMDLEQFRQEYGVQDTLDDGCRAIQELVHLFPEYFLCFSFQAGNGTYVLVNEQIRFDTTALRDTDKFKKFMAGLYYLLHAMTCDLEATRKGPIIITDCRDVGWSMKNDFRIIKEVVWQLVAIYPIQPMLVRHYNTGVIFNLLFTMVKRVLPKSVAKRFESGLTKDAPLRDVFLVPTVEAATQRVIEQLQSALKRRYDHEKTFKLN